jgi:ABC-type uncharacterized transport system auxiliary subunit
MMRVFLLLLAFTLAGCSRGAVEETSNPVDELEIHSSSSEAGPAPELANLGVAPELNNQVWLNSEKALRLADLRGKVVLLEMWTFG